MKFLKNLKLQSFLFPFLLILIVSALCYTNYTPGTWLSGWDTLHPEFNFPLYLKRTLFGAWQEHQGVGAAPSQAHAAELPRLLLLYPLSLIIPASAVRYSFFFLTLYIGTLGMYFFLLSALKPKKKIAVSFPLTSSAFLGSLFYLLNLSTLQHFYVPLEMFAVHFATLPFLFLFAIKYLKAGSKKHLLLFTVTNLFAASMAHTATLFYVYLGALTLFLGTYCLFSKSKETVRRSIYLVLLTLLLNIYWIIPNLWYILFHSQEVRNSWIHSTFSGEAFLQSRSFGNLSNLALSKNFLFNWKDYDFTSESFTPLLNEWDAHLSTASITLLGYLIFTIAIAGFAFSATSSSTVGLSIIPILAISVFFLINQNPPTEAIFSLLRNNFSLVKEGLRFPFTKFSIFYEFTLSLFFANAFYLFFSKQRRRFPNLTSILTTVFATLSLIYFMLPAFQGNLISNNMKVTIPNEYFEMFSWFESQPNGKVLKLPADTPWGWNYHDWGYQGAGFTWFGISRPTFDREFDRWNSHNETFYQEISHAINSQEFRRFSKLMNKYNIRHIVVDFSVRNSEAKPNKNQDKIVKFLDEQKDISLVHQFNFLHIYQVNSDTPDIFAPQTYTPINANLTYSSVDPLYIEYGDYHQSSHSLAFPFINFDHRANISTKSYRESLRLSANLPEFLANSFTIPNFLATENSLPLTLSILPEKESFTLSLELTTPKLSINNQGQYQETVSHLQEFNFPVSDISYIGIDNSFYTPDELITQKTTVVNKAQDLTLALFSNSPRPQAVLTTSLLSQPPRLCGDPDVTFSSFGTEIVFNTSDQAICQGTNFTVNQDALYKIDFQFSSTNSSSPYVCIIRSSEETCLNNPYSTSPIFLTAGSYWIDFVGHPTPTQNTTTYSNLAITAYPKYAEVASTSFNSYADLLPSGTFETNARPISSIEIDLPLANITSESFAPNRGYPEATNCDTQKVGNVQKMIHGKGVYYKAEDGGVSCDFFDYPALSHSQAYILHLKGTNLSGRSLKYYLFNTATNRVDLENLLPTGNFDEYHYILPTNSQSIGFILNIETRAFGRIASENIVETIEFIPVPIDWLSSIHLGHPEPQPNNLQVLDSKKTGTAFYKATLKGDSGLLVLSQAYEKGWIAFDKSGNLLPHTKVNSWSNGWLIDHEIDTVYIFYWPQLLEFLGLLLLPLTFIILLL